MTTVKITGKPRAAAAGSLEAFADWLYTHPGGRVVGVIEFVHTERSEPAPEEDRDRTVTLAISALELATAEQEETLRRSQRAMYLMRTALGTLDPDGEVEMSQRILDATFGDLGVHRAIQLEIAVRHWADKALQVFQTPNLQPHELRHELDLIATGLRAASLGLRRDEEEGGGGS